MTTVVAALDRIARDVSVEVPSDWITTTETAHVEIRDDFLLETVADVTDRLDWPDPISDIYDLTGSGVNSYTLPAQFKRLQRGPLAVYEETRQRKCRPVTTDDLGTYIADVGWTGIERYYKIEGYEGAFTIYFIDAPTATDDFKIHYVTDYWCASSGGTLQSTFAAVGDILRLPRRLVETGTIYRWRERKGLPFTDKKNEYEMLMTRYGDDMRGRRTFSFGEPETLKPWDVPVPDFIPSA